MFALHSHDHIHCISVCMFSGEKCVSIWGTTPVPTHPPTIFFGERKVYPFERRSPTEFLFFDKRDGEGLCSQCLWQPHPTPVLLFSVFVHMFSSSVFGRFCLSEFGKSFVQGKGITQVKWCICSLFPFPGNPVFSPVGASPLHRGGGAASQPIPVYPSSGEFVMWNERRNTTKVGCRSFVKRRKCQR